MSLAELFILAVGLSMDAFAVSMCKGLARKKPSVKSMLTAGAYFGGFQALMPFIGYMLGVGFSDIISSLDHWIAFSLLTLIGANMIKESFKEEEEKSEDGSMDFKAMLLLAVATSIDALAVGVTLAFLKVAIVPAVLFIGCTTFVISAVGVYLGGRLGENNRINASLIGGIILIGIGLKILLEHLGILG